MTKYHERKLFDAVDKEKITNDERIRVILQTLTMLDEHHKVAQREILEMGMNAYKMRVKPLTKEQVKKANIDAISSDADSQKAKSQQRSPRGAGRR